MYIELGMLSSFHSISNYPCRFKGKKKKKRRKLPAMKIIAFQTENHSDNFIKCTFLEGGGEKKKKRFALSFCS